MSTIGVVIEFLCPDGLQKEQKGSKFCFGVISMQLKFRVSDDILWSFMDDALWRRTSLPFTFSP